MRKIFAESIERLAREDERVVFLTGDLGFMALERLRDSLGKRFINAGVAEQNMVSVAAGLAAKGFHPWVYSIAPFVTLRCLEQIRNDICLHDLPTVFVGNGGGYGYGIMGATHHAPEDIALMRSMPGMEIFLPVTGSDVAACVASLRGLTHPAYLRLNTAASLAEELDWVPWRAIGNGKDLAVLTIGSSLAPLVESLEPELRARITIFNPTRIPLTDFPESLLEHLKTSRRLLIIEEHQTPGGLGECFARQLLSKGIGEIRFASLTTQGYPSGRYGSQRWHQTENRLAGPCLREQVVELLDG